MPRKARGKRSNSRKFYGNRFKKRAREQLQNEASSSSSSSESETETVSANKELESADVSVNKATCADATPTRTERKLKNLYCSSSSDETDSESYDCDTDTNSDSDDSASDSEILLEQQLEGYRLIDVDILNRNVSSQLKCKFCGGDVSLHEIERKGLGCNFAFLCTSKKCDKQQAFPSCPIIAAGNVSVYSVNRHSAFAMRCAGGDRSSLQTFCGILGLPQPVQGSSFRRINKTINEGAVKIQKKSMKKAAELEHKLADSGETLADGTELRNIDVSVDGTYMTRGQGGHSSNIGASTLIGLQTGKVLDTGVKSKLCHSCQYWAKQDKTSQRYRDWEARHEGKCTINHQGSSGAMEGDIAKSMFCRSIELYNLRYVNFIGDGDTNSFKRVQEAKPYGEIEIQKIECVGHVQKRMGKRLRDLKKNSKGKILADGKTIGGMNRLTDKEINKMTEYYGNAIRGNSNNLEKMRNAVWAIYFHKLSSDSKPIHNFCLEEWCPYLQAKAEGRHLTYRHKNNMPEAVMSEIKPIFKDLANTALLQKCIHGYTQNANESINSVIWKFCPKTKHHGLIVAETAVALAVCIFNDGCQTLCEILDAIQINAGQFTKSFCANKDTIRIITSQKKALEATKEMRKLRKRQRVNKDEQAAARENYPYLRGAH